MKVLRTALDGVLLLELAQHRDERGSFLETFKEASYRDSGIGSAFVQDNLSRSHRKVLRGLHYQRRQGKLPTVVRGEIQDVALDVRPDSQHFGKWLSTTLSGEENLQLYIPPGFAHGFCVLSDEACVWYKTTDIYRPEEEGGVRWDDPDLGIDWKVEDPILSDRDRRQPRLKEVDRKSLITRRELLG